MECVFDRCTRLGNCVTERWGSFRRKHVARPTDRKETLANMGRNSFIHLLKAGPRLLVPFAKKKGGRGGGAPAATTTAAVCVSAVADRFLSHKIPNNQRAWVAAA